MAGMFTSGRTYVRPDIVIAKEVHYNAKDLKSIDVVVECKEDEIKWNDLRQILEYKNRYNPRGLILTSVKSIPDNLKAELDRLNVISVDELKLGNYAAINNLKNALMDVL